MRGGTAKDRGGDTYRAIYTVRFAKVVHVLHAFQKKSKKGRGRSLLRFLTATLSDLDGPNRDGDLNAIRSPIRQTRDL